MKCSWIPLLLFLLVLPLAVAEDQVVINSRNWQDVYSGIIYAQLLDLEVHYIAEEIHGLQLIQGILNRNAKEVLLIESAEKPFVFGYQSKLEAAGFVVEKLLSENPKKANLELTRRILEEKVIKNFIVIGGDLGYSAISVAPYATLTNSSVLFVDDDNLDDAFSFLSDNEKSILLYGHLDRDVRERFSALNPETISTGDRHLDNIEIVKKFLQKRPEAKQIFFTNGEFIEPGLFSDEFPSLFIGTTNIPEKVIDFITESDIRVAVVIGYDLYSNAQRIKEITGIRTFLKYGQGRDSQLYALDIYPIPSYDASIGIKAVRYNTITKQLEVIYENTGEIYTYIQALLHDLQVDDETVATVGDENAFYLDDGDVKAIVYDVDLTDYLDETIVAESKVAYGESPSSLVKILTVENIIEFISIEDNSKIRIKSVVYNKRTKRFEIIVENIGEDNVFVDLEIVDLIIADEETTLGADQQMIAPGREKLFKIRALLEDVDFEDNPTVTVHAKYGVREDALILSLTEEFDLAFKSINSKLIAVAVIIVILLLLVFLILKRRREEEET